jgi:type IV pilus assembly protein PilF
MKMRIALLILVLISTACATSTQEREDEENKNRKAAETNTALGQGYMQREQYEIALEKLKKAVAFDKTYAPAHTVLAILYETIGELDQAETEYAEAVKYDPGDGDINNNYGAFLCSIGKSKDADQYFQKAVKDPFYKTPAVAYLNAGNCALAQGDLDKADVFLRQSLEYDNKLPSALISMADVSYQSGNYMRARAFLQRFGSVGAWDEDSLLLGYRIESKLGDAETANEYRMELLEQFPNSSQASWVTGQEQE